MKDAGLHERVLGRVAVSDNDSTGIGNWKKIQLLYDVVPFREVIFCEGTLSFKDIIEHLGQLPGGTILKFRAHGSGSIVGSQSKDSSGEFVAKENGFKLNQPHNRRLKRLIDITVSLLALLTFPIHLFTVKKPISFFGHCFVVLFARNTWIGYSVPEKNLPALRRAVMTCNGIPASVVQQLPLESLQMIDYWYAKDYVPLNDLKLIKRTYRHLGL
jgi:hypothetical protein